MLTTDPFVTTDPDLLPLDEVVARSDLLILCTPHRQLQERRSQGQAGGRRVGDPGEREPDRLGPVRPRSLRRKRRRSLATERMAHETDGPSIDIVIPVYNEGANILATLRALARERQDAGARADLLRPRRRRHAAGGARQSRRACAGLDVEFVRNPGRGAHARGDGRLCRKHGRRSSWSIRPTTISTPASSTAWSRWPSEGCDIVCASRFMPGGTMQGCPVAQGGAGAHRRRSRSTTSRALPTHDPTSGFRLFSRRVIDRIEVESDAGLLLQHRTAGEGAPARLADRRGAGALVRTPARHQPVPRAEMAAGLSALVRVTPSRRPSCAVRRRTVVAEDRREHERALSRWTEQWPKIKSRADHHDLAVDRYHRARGRIRARRTDAEIYHAVGQLDYLAIVALTPDGRFPLVRQYRPALEAFTWELPAGLVEPGEDPADGLPARTARGNRLSDARHPSARDRGAPAPAASATGSIPIFCRPASASTNFVPEPGLSVELATPSELMAMITVGRIHPADAPRRAAAGGTSESFIVLR